MSRCWAGSDLGAAGALGRGLLDAPTPVAMARPTGAWPDSEAGGRCGQGVGWSLV